MKDKYPRTVSEFATHQRVVSLRCLSCGYGKDEDLTSLAMTFGNDFDLYDGLSEVSATLRCSNCGERYPEVVFRSPAKEPFRSVSFEQSVINTLEDNAYFRARATRPEDGSANP